MHKLNKYSLKKFANIYSMKTLQVMNKKKTADINPN